MIKKKMRKMFFATIAAVMMSTAGIGSAAGSQENGMIGMPNPIVEYQTYNEAADAIGFMPLYLPKVSGYSCDYVSVIGKKTADLGFQKLGEANSKLRVRTARQESFSSDDISGIYSVTWDQININDTAVSIAKIKDNAYAAHWQIGNYLFAAQAEGVSYLQFMSLLSDSLVDLSAHYYR